MIAQARRRHPLLRGVEVRLLFAFPLLRRGGLPARNALACEADGDKEINWVCPNSGGAEKLVKEFLTI